MGSGELKSGVFPTPPAVQNMNYQDAHNMQRCKVQKISIFCKDKQADLNWLVTFMLPNKQAENNAQRDTRAYNT